MFESHITFEPWTSDEQRGMLFEIAKDYGFRVSNWTMTNHDKSELPKEVFFTQTGLVRATMETRMAAVVTVLRHNGYKVKRYKIEQILLDSKIVDELNLLPCATKALDGFKE